MTLLSVADAAMTAGRSPATLARWARRGLLTRYGHPRRPMYDDLELADAAEKMRDTVTAPRDVDDQRVAAALRTARG